MKGNQSKASSRALRLVAVLACGLGASITTMAWAPGAQAAGNVQVRAAEGDLVITGDDHDNNIIVIREFTSIRVAGRAQTTVNGGRSGQFDDPDATNDVVIQMKDGVDFVRVEVASGPNLAFP